MAKAKTVKTQKKEKVEKAPIKYTYRNDRTNQEVILPLSPLELASEFAKLTEGRSWLYFYMAKTVEELRTAPGMRDALAFISDTFVLAVGRGLTNPMIRLGFREYDRRYKIYIARTGTVCIKGGNLVPGTSDPLGDEEYIGCLYSGRFRANDRRTLLEGDKEFLDRLQKDPVAFFIKCSKDMDRCCYCNRPLEDPRSKDAGYGATCALRWGLPWGNKKGDQNFSSFADLWSRTGVEKRRDIRGLCLAIRTTPRDELPWLALRDALEEAGWPDNRLPSMPKKVVKIPRP